GSQSFECSVEGLLHLLKVRYGDTERTFAAEGGDDMLIDLLVDVRGMVLRRVIEHHFHREAVTVAEQFLEGAFKSGEFERGPPLLRHSAEPKGNRIVWPGNAEDGCEQDRDGPDDEEGGDGASRRGKN